MKPTGTEALGRFSPYSVLPDIPTHMRMGITWVICGNSHVSDAQKQAENYFCVGLFSGIKIQNLLSIEFHPLLPDCGLYFLPLLCAIRFTNAFYISIRGRFHTSRCCQLKFGFVSWQRGLKHTSDWHLLDDSMAVLLNPAPGSPPAHFRGLTSLKHPIQVMENPTNEQF